MDIYISAEVDDWGLDPYDIRILLRISRRGECWETIDNMAMACRMSHNTVRRAINNLICKKIITKQQRPGASAIYKINPIADWLKQSPTPTILGTPPLPYWGHHPYHIRDTTPTILGTPPLPYWGHEDNPFKVIPLNNPIEKKKTEIPDWLDHELWLTWIGHRKEKRKEMTESTKTKQLKKLEKWRDIGYNPNDIIENAIEKGWTGLFIDKSLIRIDKPPGKWLYEAHKLIENFKPSNEQQTWLDDERFNKKSRK